MLANRLYSALWKQMIQLRPKERITRLRNMSWLMVGIYLSRSVHLSKIALKIPGRAKVPSITRRLTRFLDNPAIRVREWFEPIARAILQTAASTVGEIRLIADGTKVGFGHQLLTVSLAFRSRHCSKFVVRIGPSLRSEYIHSATNLVNTYPPASLRAAEGGEAISRPVGRLLRRLLPPRNDSG